MRVQQCPSCGARYNVERLADGAAFACRRCDHIVEVGTREPPTRRFSLGLLIAGTFLIAGLFLSSNPNFGSANTEWPWELLRGGVAWSSKIVIVLWAIAGLWALLTSLGVAVRTRSVFTIALAGLLLMMCTSPGIVDLKVDAPLLPLPLLLAVTALASGLLLEGRADTTRMARVLAFGGGLAVLGWHVLCFSGQAPCLEALLNDTVRLANGDLDAVSVWAHAVPAWALLLAGIVGLLVGFGAKGRFFVWTGMILLLVLLLTPSIADLVHCLGDDTLEVGAGRQFAASGGRALVSSGFALWLLAAHSVVDLVRNR